MARLHVIYDPNNKVNTNSEMAAKLGFKVAILDINPDIALDSANFRTTAEQLVEILLEQCRG